LTYYIITADIRLWEQAGRPEPLCLVMYDPVGMLLGAMTIEKIMRADQIGNKFAHVLLLLYVSYAVFTCCYHSISACAMTIDTWMLVVVIVTCLSFSVHVKCDFTMIQLLDCSSHICDIVVSSVQSHESHIKSIASILC
jgi:hypothetical protein